MEEHIYVSKQLRNMKILFGAFLIALFVMMYEVFNYVHIKMGVGYLTLIMGIGIIIWGISDHVKIKKKNLNLIKR